MSWEPLDLDSMNDSELIGDESFDIFSIAIEQVSRTYLSDLNRLPSSNEIIETFKRALENQLSDVANDGSSKNLVSLSATFENTEKQQCKVGDILQATLSNGMPIYARLFAIQKPGLGYFLGVFDSMGMSSTNLQAITEKELIVKMIPIHAELISNPKEWCVIGNIPLSVADKRHPIGPLEISSSNNHLASANYYYELIEKPFFGVENWLNHPTQNN